MHVMPPVNSKSEKETNSLKSVQCGEECHPYCAKSEDINKYLNVDCNKNHYKSTSTPGSAALLSSDELSVQWHSTSACVPGAAENIKIQQASYGIRCDMNGVDMCHSFLQILNGQQDNNWDTVPVCCGESHTEIQLAKTHTNMNCSGDNVIDPQRVHTFSNKDGNFVHMRHFENLCNISEVPHRDSTKECSKIHYSTSNSKKDIKTVAVLPYPGGCSSYDNFTNIQINKQENHESTSGIYNLEQRENSNFNLQETPFEISVQTAATSLAEILLKISDGTTRGEDENNIGGKEHHSHGNLKDIMSYLDEIENASTEVQDSRSSSQQTINEKQRERISHREYLRNVHKEKEELTDKDGAGLTQYVKTLELQLEDRERSLLLARQALSQQKEDIQQSKRKMELKIHSCKRDYDDVILRHQKFIDQLIADKETLNEKCKSLVHELKVTESRHASNLKAAEERHRIDIQKVRDMHAAAEKIRRDKWIENKTKKIKEMTVKGLEPELNRMSEQHEKELSELRAQHEKELCRAQQDADHRLKEQAKLLQEEARRHQLEETAHEAARIKARYERQLEELEELQQEQREKLLEDISKEKECFAKERKKHMDELRKFKESLNTEKLEEIKQVECRWRESTEALVLKYQTEEKMLRDSLEMEKAAWMHDCEKKQKLYLLEKETEIRDEYKRNRDQEIEKAIEKLEKDCEKMKLETEMAAEAKTLRLKEQYDADVRELEVVISSLRSKCDEAKEMLHEREDELVHLNTSIRQLEKELLESHKLIEQLSSERADVKEVIRKEFISQIITSEEENIQLREQMAEMRAYHQMEVAAKEKDLKSATAEKEHEFQELYKRVKTAISKKDKAIQELNLKYRAAVNQCSHLENLLEQHQRDHLFR